MLKETQQQELQQTFLNHLRKIKAAVTIFLGNGVRLQGIITGFDTFAILLKRGVEYQLVYKHAISTIMPVDPIKLYEEEEDSKKLILTVTGGIL